MSHKPSLYYIRDKGKTKTIGLTGNEGETLSLNTTIDVVINDLPEKIATDNDLIEIPDEFEDILLAGVVYWYFHFNPSTRFPRDVVATIRRVWAEGLRAARGKAVRRRRFPTIISPLNIQTLSNGSAQGGRVINR